jgi:hypothetical protein
MIELSSLTAGEVVLMVSWFNAAKTLFFLALSLYLAVRATQLQDEYRVVTQANGAVQVQESVRAK